ncbi:MAG: class I SAM-dependent methyltransferase [Cardiobacteriaceae bacterium]|nr:class I SAM-dependent methyltransferase [Cardiobacteriaceae bacterium]
MNTEPNLFDRNARQWDSRPISRQLAPLPERLLAELTLSADQHVLDFGAGTGLLATAIAPYVAQVTALDTSSEMLAVLNEKGFANIRTLQQDIFAGLSGQYHAIVSCMALHHVENIAALLATFADALLPGGELALIDLYAEDGSFHGDNIGKGVKHLGFDTDHLQTQVAATGLQHIRVREILQLQRDTRHYPLFLLRAQKPLS